MKKEKSVGGLSVKAVVFSAIVAFFALLCDPISLTLNVVRKDKLLFNFFTIAAPRYDYAPEDIAGLYYGVNVILVLLVVATLVLSILALLNQKGKMSKATNGIAKALKILSMLTLIFVGLIGNLVNVVLSFMMFGGYGAISLVVYLLVIIFTVILKNRCGTYANKVLPAKQEEKVEESK